MNIDIIRAWKDASYRQSLSEEEQALLPTHPAGTIELHASELERVNGGADLEAVVYSGQYDPRCNPTPFTVCTIYRC